MSDTPDMSPLERALSNALDKLSAAQSRVQELEGENARLRKQLNRPFPSKTKAGVPCTNE